MAGGVNCRSERVHEEDELSEWLSKGFFSSEAEGMSPGVERAESGWAVP
jgi:hypothetical protein